MELIWTVMKGARPYSISPLRFTADVRQWLTENYRSWIGRARTVPLDFYPLVWGIMKQGAQNPCEEEPNTRIDKVAARKVRENLTLR